MLRGLDFYRRSVELAEKHRRPHQRPVHTIQTNGTLIDDRWAAFFKENKYLVGLSLDGPRAMHDAYRVTKHNEGSFDEVVRGWNCLRKHEVDVNILCTIHAANADHPLEVYRFFRDELGAQYIQLFRSSGRRPRKRSRPPTRDGVGREGGTVRSTSRKAILSPSAR
jgi:uncharacterized protein